MPKTVQEKSPIVEALEWVAHAPHGNARAFTVRTNGTGTFILKRVENGFSISEHTFKSLSKLYKTEEE